MDGRSWVIPLKMPDSQPNGNRPNAVLRINHQENADALPRSQRRNAALSAGLGRGADDAVPQQSGLRQPMWDYPMTAFADQGFRCIGFDRRGQGRSDQPARGYDHDTFADDVATLISFEISKLRSQPNVKAKACTPGSRNSILNVWSPTSPVC